MAVTILERPEGRIYAGCQLSGTATVDESYGTGDASFVDINHALNDADYIYATSDIENYAGFWYVDKITDDIFKLKQYPSGSYVQFIANGEIDWCWAFQSHKWSCVHLPITYRISTDLYPTNSSDTTRNINSVQDANGYAVLQLSGSLGTIHTYDFITVTVPNDTDYSGVYQIVEWISATVVIINLEYDSAINFTSATAQKRYNNYNIIVRVYAGINASHQWALQKPYELAATKEFIPDENNEVFFSIDDILKSYIETRNNTLLGTLPNNIDFWTQFYIEVAESYDDSDGYTFGRFTGNYTSDQSTFEGYAANAKLEFKNIFSGYLSDYIMNYSTAKFLTNFSTPVIFNWGYQDISFINVNENADTIIRLQYYLDGSPSGNDSIVLGIIDQGIIRVPLTANCDHDRVDVYVEINSSIVSETKTFGIDCGCSNQDIGITWLNNLGGFEYWSFTAKKDHIIEIKEALTTKKNILPAWPKSYGANADTIRKQTVRVSNKAYTVRSQFLTESEADAIAYIKSSVLVQIINSRTDRRTVLVDTDSFIVRKDGDKTFEAIFNISFTDDIPTQTT